MEIISLIDDNLEPTLPKIGLRFLPSSAKLPPTFKGLNNSGLSTDYGSNQLRFSYLSDGLTDTEAANFYTAVQAFQTTLGRNVWN